MTTHYIPIIQQHLQTKYPQYQQQQSLSIQNIRFKLFLPKTTLMLLQYHNLKSININHCDLRNLDNFPKIYSLEQIDLGFNQIQGTFNNLMPLKRLQYLNIQHNLIFESIKLAPLRKIASLSNTNSQQKNQSKISICIRNNPFLQEDTPYLIKFKNYGLKVIKQPKEYFEKKKQQQQKIFNKNKSSLSDKKGKKNKNYKQSLLNKNDKKHKTNWFEQSQNEDSSLMQHNNHHSLNINTQTNNNTHSLLSSNTHNNLNPSNNNHRNQVISRMQSGLISNEDRMHYLRVSRNNIMDNYGGRSATNQQGRMLVRLGAHRDERAELINLDDLHNNNNDNNRFVSIGGGVMMGEQQQDQQQDDDMNEMNDLRDMFGFQNDQDDMMSDSDQDQEQQDRFGNVAIQTHINSSNINNQSANLQQRLHLIQRRNQRLQYMRQIQRRHRLERDRLRLQRRMLQRQTQMLRRRQLSGRSVFERRREEVMARRQQEREMLRQQERDIIRRLSERSGGVRVGSNSNSNSNFNSSGSGNSSGRQSLMRDYLGPSGVSMTSPSYNPNISRLSVLRQQSGLRRPMSYRETVERRILNSSVNTDLHVGNSNGISNNISGGGGGIANTAVIDSMNNANNNARSIGSLLIGTSSATRNIRSISSAQHNNQNQINSQRHAALISPNQQEILFGDNNQQMRVFNNGIDDGDNIIMMDSYSISEDDSDDDNNQGEDNQDQNQDQNQIDQIGGQNQDQNDDHHDDQQQQVMHICDSNCNDEEHHLQDQQQQLNQQEQEDQQEEEDQQQQNPQRRQQQRRQNFFSLNNNSNNNMIINQDSSMNDIEQQQSGIFMLINHDIHDDNVNIHDDNVNLLIGSQNIQSSQIQYNFQIDDQGRPPQQIRRTGNNHQNNNNNNDDDSQQRRNNEEQ